jgi:hypothetical protein
MSMAKVCERFYVVRGLWKVASGNQKIASVNTRLHTNFKDHLIIKGRY